MVTHGNGSFGGSAAGGDQPPDRVELILDRTPFYAESGGQIADEGSISGASGAAKAAVTDVQKIAKTLWAHRVNVESGEFVEGDTVIARQSTRGGGTARRRAIPAPTWCMPHCDKCWAPMRFRPAR